MSKGSGIPYVEGKETKKLSCTIPKRKESYYTVKKEIILHARDQYTFEPDIKH
ncbi:sugar isomerase [Enterococcus faecium]|nr:sugar isomerase [Enterococcus faecium]TNX59993.1 sugar isomerase [Enterococcus faecium]TNX67723.1 sugar isomerase [Enterococcus faecium]